MNYLNLKEASHKDISTAVEMLEKKNVFFLDLNGTVGDSNNTNAENVVTSEMANSIGQLLETRVIVLNSGWDLKGIQARILDKLETIVSINWSN
ncbi:hypothetical protein KBB25_02125, partial [Candidatus Gracilibacteria bacterium]|nr:hypothetical protein [Candidatus Gracilibacteria bacterium]